MKTSKIALKTTLCFLLLLFLAMPSTIFAQERDSICIAGEDPLAYDLSVYGLNNPWIEIGANGCFRTQGKNLVWSSSNGVGCCGEHDLLIIDLEGQGTLELHVTVKCAKPECFITDVTDTGGEPTAGGPVADLYACSESVTTYYLPTTIGYTYDWITDQGDTGTGSTIDVTWLTAGTHSITVNIYSGVTLINTITRQVNVLAAPLADFTKSASCVCLGGNISFDASSSVGASSYNWDFGDGSSGDGQFTNHSYDTPGTYNVILTVGSNNYDAEGNPLCCCSDTMAMEVIVENEEGPPVYWISTLCEGDSSIYWTNATNCASLTWVVTDYDGNIISHTVIDNDLVNDTIAVVWPIGPYGTISLTALGCDENYCTKPSVVQVPVISMTSFVTGDEIVCEGDSKNYSVPKWHGVEYEWNVSGGTVIPNGNTATVIWDDPTATTGTVAVSYSNDFLSGLMMAEPCVGSGFKDVEIRPKFRVLKDTTVCFGSTLLMSTNDPGQSFTWTVQPAASYAINVVSANEVEITWDEAGTYIVKATPVDPNFYCIDCHTATIVVKQMAEPLGIDGETEVCLDDLYYYTAESDQPGVEYNWTIVGGLPTSGTGNPIAVTWDGSDPSPSISLTQYDLNDPGCESLPITLPINIKAIDPDIVINEDGGCTNQIQTYTVTGSQHADATVKWEVSLEDRGSVIDVIGQNSADIQWNNTAGSATIFYSVMLCGDTVTVMKTVTLTDADQAAIIQVGSLCPGVPGMLQADPGFMNYEWSTGDNGPSNMTTILTPGTYTLTTTDGNMCEDIQFFEAVGSPLPVAFISTNDLINCIDTSTVPPPMPTNIIEISALTAPGYTYSWECNGNLLPGSPIDIFHPNTYVPGSFLYRVTVTDTNTGCTNVSNSLVVTQDYCDTCRIENHTIDITATNDPVYCNIFTFNETHSPNVNPTSWSFDDGNFAGYSGPSTTHTYSAAGDYAVRINGLVYDLDTSVPNDTCPTFDFVPIEVPLAPFFTYEDSCLMVDFSDYSSYIGGESIVGYEWDFDDGGAMSTMSDPSHMFSGPGSYTVELIITGSSGCEAIYTETITISSGASPVISLSPTMACVGESITFTGSHPNDVVEWLWDFGDMSENGAQIAEHAYLAAGTYMITLTTLTTDGCETMATASVLIKPNPVAMGINASGPLEFCDGDNVTLSVVAAGSATYNWTTLETTPSIVMDTTGTYYVTVTENGCDTILGPIEVFVYPEVNTSILGENYICEGECAFLYGPVGTGYMYQWLDDNFDPIPGQTFRQYFTCYNIHPPYVYLQITDANGCTSVSDPWLLESGAKPVVAITNLGDYCAGSPNVLIANITTPGMTNADVTFIWSTGEVGNSIVVDAAGQYSATAVHNITSCSGTRAITINPLPDFCIMPVGCYTVCDPDTLWGPAGLAAYQWNKDGSAIAGATLPYYYVTMTGSYSLTGTTDLGCTGTSDTLILEVKTCYDCELTHVSAEPTSNSTGNECCYVIDYTLGYDSIVSLDISTGDADILIGNLTADHLLFSNAGGNAIINSTSASGLFSQGTTAAAFDLCLTNITSSPQTIIFSWIHATDGVVCTDTLILDCEVSTDCAYIKNLDIYCEGEDQYMSFDLCNPINALFTVRYFSMFTQGAINFGLVPLDFDITGTPLYPGDCQNFTVLLTGSGIEYEELCLGAIVHSDSPHEVPDALCCTIDSVACFIVPGCTPCEQTDVSAYELTEGNDCCYAVDLFNGYDLVFTNININVLNAGTSIAINNPIGSPWTPTSITPTEINLLYSPGEVPLGTTALPDICVTATNDAVQQIEIQWMIGDEVICIDTLNLECEPPCGYFLEEHQQIICLDDGTWVFQGIFKNTSGYTISEVYLAFDAGSGLDAYNQTITGLSIPPGGTSPIINVPIGPPANAGDDVCMNLTLHSIDADGNPFACCVFKHCITLPQCDVEPRCICDSQFEDEVEMGISCTFLPDFNVSFVNAGNLLDCDVVTYSIDGDQIMSLPGNVGFSFSFPGPGSYEICIRVERTDENGEQCKAKYCKKLELEQTGLAGIAVYPNPSAASFNIDLSELKIDEQTHISIYDLNQKLVMTCKPDLGNEKITNIKAEDLQDGLYFILVDNGISVHRKSILIVR